MSVLSLISQFMSILLSDLWALQGLKDWQKSSVQYWQVFFFMFITYIYTLCDQLRKYHFVPVCHGLMWNIETILAFESGYKHDKDIEVSYNFYCFIGGTNTMGSSKLK